LGLTGGETVGARSDPSDDADDDDDDIGSNDEDMVDGNVQNGTEANTSEYQESGSGIVLQKVFRSKITRGWLEQIFIMDGELLLLGFFNKKLFVYNESKHFEVGYTLCPLWCQLCLLKTRQLTGF
jgi:hypothetical protein